MPFLSPNQKHQRTGEIILLYLKYNRLVISLQVEGKYVGVHKSLATLTQNVDGFLEKLNFNPRHVVLLHCFHAFFDSSIQLQYTMNTLA